MNWQERFYLLCEAAQKQKERSWTSLQWLQFFCRGFPSQRGTLLLPTKDKQIIYNIKFGINWRNELRVKKVNSQQLLKVHTAAFSGDRKQFETQTTLGERFPQCFGIELGRVLGHEKESQIMCLVEHCTHFSSRKFTTCLKYQSMKVKKQKSEQSTIKNQKAILEKCCLLNFLKRVGLVEDFSFFRRFGEGDLSFLSLFGDGEFVRLEELEDDELSWRLAWRLFLFFFLSLLRSFPLLSLLSSSRLALFDISITLITLEEIKWWRAKAVCTGLQ